MTDPREAVPFDPEKMTEPFVDDDYDTRAGYDPDFLGIAVPIPRVADTSVVAQLEDGSGYVIPYEHFSVVLHEKRRLALFTAANVDGREERKKPEPGRDYSRRGLSGLGRNDHEKWVLDPRVGQAAQLPDKFYTKDRGNFDKGHVVRRDDVAWGADFDEVRRANGDTYHVTNCSPQVDAFNRSNLRGEWGKLENNVLKQAKAEKLCVFGGPILDDENDKIFRGVDDEGEVAVQVPSLFWKLVVARAGDRLEAFAFLLEQDLSDADVEFNVDAEWQSKMISIADLQDLVPDLEFDARVQEADQAATASGESIRSSGGIESYGGPGSAAPAAGPGEPVTAEEAGAGSPEPAGAGGDGSGPEAAGATPAEAAGDEADAAGPAAPAAEAEAAPEGPIEWDDGESPAELQEALAIGDHARAGGLLDALHTDLEKYGRVVDATAAKKVLGTLRKYAWFDKLKQTAAAFDRHAMDDVQVLRQLAQARIELGEITTAVGGLQKLKKRIEGELEEEGLSAPEKKRLRDELGETMGLLGRCYKQYYVNARPSRVEPRQEDLTRSLEYYGGAFDELLGDYLWHGINYVALLTHKERVAKDKHNAISKEAGKRAEEILLAIADKEATGTLYYWDLANRIEANLALGRTKEAIAATQACLDSPGTDAFAVQGTRRQLTEVWMLREDQPPGNEILPMMNACFAELGGTPEAIELDLGQAAAYEKVWGKTKYKSLRWLGDAMKRATSVARIGPSKYDGDGTGFLFDGSWISDKWAGKPLLLTNAHVCSDDPAVLQQVPYPSRPEELTAAFLGSGGASGAVELRFEKLLWTSPPAKLDATLLLLESVPEGCEPPPVTQRQPPVTVQGDSRLNILGHPKGLDLRISLQDNKTVAVGDRYVHYQTPTDPGSSGSPVFDQKWRLVALHHASSPTMKANEGIRIDVIIDAIRKKLA